MLNGQISDWRDVLSGVPQGSVLGPFLFLIFINDIDESVGCKILKFADDSKMYNKIRSDEDTANLQSDLCNLVSWLQHGYIPIIQQNTRDDEAKFC